MIESVITSVVISVIITMFGDVALKSKEIKLRYGGLIVLYLFIFVVSLSAIRIALYYLSNI